MKYRKVPNIFTVIPMGQRSRRRSVRDIRGIAVYSSIGSADQSVTQLLDTPSDGSAISSVLIDLGADFIGANICIGKTIFGRDGSAACGGALIPYYFNNAADPAPTQTVFSSTPAIGSAYSYVEIDLGSDFAVGNICFGMTIFGRGGNAFCSIPGGYSLSDIGSADQNITSVSHTPLAGTSINSVLVDLGADFKGANICVGKTIFGRAGSATCGGGGGGNSSALLASNIHRDKASAQITIEDEIAAGSLPSGYREIPKIAVDDDGYMGSSVTKATRSAAACGTSQPTIEDRIADCNHSWDGATKGNAGQGLWKLVTYTGSKEVWRDERTQLLWSDYLANTNWCKASGNAEASDPNNYCNDSTYQNQTTPESWCAEVAGRNTPSTYDAAKGGMRAATTPSVRWRLPTKYDWQMADNNGVRFVLPYIGSALWSASVYSSNRSNAWFFNGDNGHVSGITRNNSSALRCVGR